MGNEGLRELGIIGADGLDTNGNLAEQRQLLCGGVGEVDDGVRFVGPAVVDPHKGGTVVVEVGDAQPAAERKSAMRAGELVHVEPLAGRGALALEGAAVPGGETDLIPAVLLMGGAAVESC